MRRVVSNTPLAEGQASTGSVGVLAAEETEASLVPPPAPVERMRTEFEFELPRGYVGADGQVHRRGAMRLATARDELLPLLDDRVKRNSAYLTVVLLSRVVTRLGDLSGDQIDAFVIENLFASDLAFLQDVYRRINTEGSTLAEVGCPHCGESFTVDLAGDRLGES